MALVTGISRVDQTTRIGGAGQIQGYQRADQYTLVLELIILSLGAEEPKL